MAGTRTLAEWSWPHCRCILSRNPRIWTHMSSLEVWKILQHAHLAFWTVAPVRAMHGISISAVHGHAAWLSEPAAVRKEGLWCRYADHGGKTVSGLPEWKKQQRLDPRRSLSATAASSTFEKRNNTDVCRCILCVWRKKAKQLLQWRQLLVAKSVQCESGTFTLFYFLQIQKYIQTINLSVQNNSELLIF